MYVCMYVCIDKAIKHFRTSTRVNTRVCYKVNECSYFPHSPNVYFTQNIKNNLASVHLNV